jgi:hypothetical protein
MSKSTLLGLFLVMLFVNSIFALSYKLQRVEKEKPTYQRYLQKAQGFFNNTNTSVG